MPGGRKEQRCNDEKKLVRLAALCMVMLVGIGASSISSFAVTSHLVSFEAGEGSFANGQKVILVSVDDGDCIPLDRIPKPIQPQGKVFRWWGDQNKESGSNVRSEELARIPVKVALDYVAEYEEDPSAPTPQDPPTPQPQDPQEDEKISVDGTVKWLDTNNQDGIRPESVTMRLFADRKDTGRTEVVKKNKSTDSPNRVFSFDGLKKLNDQKQPINYTVEQETKVTGYTTTKNGPYDFVNTHAPEMKDVKVEVIWKDANEDNRPPSVRLELLADGEPVAVGLVKAREGAEMGTLFTKQPVYKKAGKPIVYTVKQDEIGGYDTMIDNSDPQKIVVTNTAVESQPEQNKPGSSQAEAGKKTPPTAKNSVATVKKEKVKKSATPKTGDPVNFVLYAGVLILSVLAFVVIRGKRRLLDK